MRTLVINTGSSSTKALVDTSGNKDTFQLNYDLDGRVVRATNNDTPIDVAGVTRETSVQWLLEKVGVVDVVAHRVVHGKDRKGPAIVDDDLVRELEGYIPLAPTHQPLNLASIYQVRELMPDLVQVACFDTSFHQSRIDAISDLPRVWADRPELKRYGFHGLVYTGVAEDLAKQRFDRVIVFQLGSGCSACAMRRERGIWKSAYTTMGNHPVDGLVMSTRSGTLDTGTILALARILENESAGDVAARLESMLTKQCGLLGLSGYSADMKELLAVYQCTQGTREQVLGARRAVNAFVERIVAVFGEYAARMGGCDALVLTGGIGENAPLIRDLVTQRLESTLDAYGTHVLVIPAREEEVMVKQARLLVGHADTVATKLAVGSAAAAEPLIVGNEVPNGFFYRAA